MGGLVNKSDEMASQHGNVEALPVSLVLESNQPQQYV
jgi:hypothetical protein